MGGFGSGNRYRLRTKRQVEDCLILDMASLRKRGWLIQGEVRDGSVSWTRGNGPVSSINLVANLKTDQPYLRLTYSVAGEALSYNVQLVQTTPHFGGVRWWFSCPVVKQGIECERQVRRLFLSGRYFGCRHCHDLTYQSRQEYDARVAELMKNPSRMRAMMDSPNIGKAYLAIKAATKLMDRNRL